MLKIQGMLAQMEQVLDGLTRNISWDVLDKGFGEFEGHSLSFFPRGPSLGVVLPNNSPGVAFDMDSRSSTQNTSNSQTGKRRAVDAVSHHSGANSRWCATRRFQLLPVGPCGGRGNPAQFGRGMVFGDESTTSAWRSDSRIEIHGPGYSKIIIGDDCIDNWEQYLDVMVSSIADNGGRSCVNGSGVWVTRHAEEIADALAERLSRIAPRDADDEAAQIAPFADPAMCDAHFQPDRSGTYRTRR